MSVITEEAVREALVRVIDPELRRSVVELEMVESVEIDGGSITVGILLTVPGCPLKASFEQQVATHVGGIAGVTATAVRFGHMNADQKVALRTRLHGNRSDDGAKLSVDPRTRVLAVVSGKGGVGKSSMTVNLALALRALGHDVGVVDADIYGYSIPGMLGLDRRPVIVDGMIVPPIAHGLPAISIGLFLDGGEAAVIWRGPMLHRALEQFLSDVHWGALDYLLIDMPPGTGDVGLSLGQLMPRAEAIVVTTPQRAAQRVAERAAAMATKLRQPVLGVIENMSPYACPCCGERMAPFGEGGGASLASTIGAPLLGEVPLEPALREAGDSGLPLMLADPDAPAAVAIARIAERIAAGPRPASAPVRIASPLAVVKG